MATLSKTAGTTLLAWADTATADARVGTAVAVAGAFAARVHCRIGRRSGTAFTVGWPRVRVEASAKASGNDAWAPVATFAIEIGTSIANTTLNGAVTAGATSFVVAAATNIAAGDVLFLKGDTDAGNEIVRVKSVSSTTITPEEAVTYAHASGNAVTDQAVVDAADVDLAGITRLRAVVDNAGSGQTVAVEVLMVTADSTA